MKKFCESLREQTKLINYFLKMKLLAKKQQKSYKMKKPHYICQEKIEKKYV